MGAVERSKRETRILELLREVRRRNEARFAENSALGHRNTKEDLLGVDPKVLIGWASRRFSISGRVAKMYLEDLLVRKWIANSYGRYFITVAGRKEIAAELEPAPDPAQRSLEEVDA